MIINHNNKGKRFTYRFNFRELSPYGAAAGLIDREDSSPMNSPLLALPSLNNENAKNDSSKNDRTNGQSNEEDNSQTRPTGGIPGPLKSPLAAFHPYASGYNMNQAALAAQASRILAARFANLPGKRVNLLFYMFVLCLLLMFVYRCVIFVQVVYINLEYNIAYHQDIHHLRPSIIRIIIILIITIMV